MPSPTSSPFYTLRLDNPLINIDEAVLKFQDDFALCQDACELVRTTQGDGSVCFVKFFDNKENLDHFVSFLEKLSDKPLDLEILDFEHQLNLQLPGNLYIRGLLPTTTSENLYDIFCPYGDIQLCKIIYDDYGFSKGYGFVNLANKVQADEAISHLNGCNVDGNNLFINHHVSKKDRLKQLELKKENYSNIYVKNIPAKIQKDQLYSLFKKFGTIESVFLPPSDTNEQESKGYGFINFKYHDDALKAQEEMNGYEILPGYEMQISRAERKKDRFQFQNLNSHYSMDYLQATSFSPVSPSSLSNVDSNAFSFISPIASTDGYDEGNAEAAGEVETVSEAESGSNDDDLSTSNSKKGGPPITPFVLAMDSSIVPTVAGLPIAGPDYQDSNLYITHLPLDFTDTDLEGLFTEFGPIVSAKVITYQKGKRNGLLDQQIGSRDARGKDPESLVGKSKGFGFVCFQKPLFASKALMAMNGYRIDSTHVLNVSFAQRKENKFQRGKLHHYNQNNLGRFYRYLSYPNGTTDTNAGPVGAIPMGLMPSAAPVGPAGPMSAMNAVGPLGPLGPLGPISPMGHMLPGVIPLSPTSDSAPIYHSQITFDEENYDAGDNDDTNIKGKSNGKGKGRNGVDRFGDMSSSDASQYPSFVPYGGYYYYPYVPYVPVTPLAPESSDPKEVSR
ncbi:hypothetical protein FOA43_001213 [Brettanomyces nanus]|uniref:RRM domain-containing protein n=1 Tax=Eeniella nana TaxID=13502 RepID=A0A875RYV3_EENNA|nr:uncharacterized protein FOA43_001213 [Brettanomyces nanus]QPG73898.1 hypothetical protein FOA43_001213 [Brettanomyces nanus]